MAEDRGLDETYPRQSVPDRRLDGWHDAHGAAGLAADPCLVLPGDFTAESCARAANLVLALDARPTAVFCANDEMAVGLIGALARRGNRVPKDFSIAGFDDIQFAACFVPAITTIHQPRRTMGEVAFPSIGRPALEPVLRRAAEHALEVDLTMAERPARASQPL